MPDVHFYFDVVCPFAYLASTQIEAICEAGGASLHFQPMLLGGVYKAIRPESKPALPVPAPRLRMTAIDLDRWAASWGVPIVLFPDGHPRRSVDAMRLATVAAEVNESTSRQVAHALYRAYWVEGRDISDRAVLASIATEFHLSLERIDAPEIKDRLRAVTDEAVRAGAFGAPTILVDKPEGRELVFGQDRLHFLEEALAIPVDKRRAPDALRPSPSPRTSPTGASGPSRTVEFYYDFSSPFTYLAATQIERIAAERGGKVEWKPFLLGGLFKELGHSIIPLFDMSDPQRHYQGDDLRHWARHWDVPLEWPSRFPMNTIAALRMCLAASEVDHPRLARALFSAYWAEDADLNDKPTLARIAASVGLDGAALLERTADPSIKARLLENGAAAVRANLFGAPSFLVGDQLFFGQDRLHFVSAALA